MSNQLSYQVLNEFFAAESSDPFLMLVTLEHITFDAPIYLVNNTVPIVSRGLEFIPFPMQITLPGDDGESAREATINFDNVTLELIDELRTVTTPIDIKIEMVLASNPNTVEYELNDLKLRSANYNRTQISAKLYMDSFLNVELTSEKYSPSLWPGIF